MFATQAVRSLLFAAGAFAAVFGVSPVVAQDRSGGRPLEHIAAVVNDDVISVLDLEVRLRLALLTAGLQDAPEIRQRLAPQVLRSLVEEKLQLQEAKRLNIAASDQEIDGALLRIAEQNKMPRAALDKYLASRSVPISALMSQIRANIAWTKLIQRKLRPTIQIGGEEIDAAIDRLRANVGKPEYLAAEIFLAVESTMQEDGVRRSAERLIEEIRRGTPFSAVARQFSQAAGAGNGGDLGWVQPGQLSDDLDRALISLRPGMVSSPIRTATGYHILMVRDQRTISAGNPAEAQVRLKQLVFPVSARADRKARIEEAARVSRTVQGCSEFDARIRAAGQESSGDLGVVRVGDLPPEFARLVSSLPIGQVSPPFGSERQVVLVAVCERRNGGGGAPNRDAVAASLSNERLDMLQRRYLIDLKRSAYVDVRM